MKFLLPLLLISLLLCACFGRETLAPESQPAGNEVLLLSGRLHLSGLVAAEDSVTFRGISPALIPVAGAQVELEESGDLAFCDANGRFRFLNILPGNYHLRATRRLPDGSQFLFRERYSLLPGIQQLPQVLRLQAPGALQGRVLNLGIPVNEIRVEVENQGGRIPDADGSWRFDQLAAGSYSIFLHREGYQSRSLGEYKVSPGAVMQIPDQNPPLLALATGSNLRLHVQVRDEYENPLASAYVQLLGNGQAAWTNDSGETVFENLAPRQLTLRVRASGFREDLRELLLENATTAVHLQLNRGGAQHRSHIQLYVEDENQNPLAAARVSVRPATISALTDRKGFALLPVDGGAGQVIVEKSGFARQQINFTATTALQQIRLQMAPAIPEEYFDVSGRLTDAGGLSLAGQVVRETFSHLATWTASDGSFTLRLPRGIRQLEVQISSVQTVRHNLDLQGNVSNIELIAQSLP